MKEQMNLVPIGRESLLTKTFGENEAKLCESEVVPVGIRTPSGEIVYTKAISVPVICGPLSHQPIDLTKTSYKHLKNFNLAVHSSEVDELSVQMLIGVDYYWSFINRTVVRGKPSEPVALSTKLGYVLSGPTVGNLDSPNINSVYLTTTYVLKITAEPVQSAL